LRLAIRMDECPMLARPGVDLSLIDNRGATLAHVAVAQDGPERGVNADDGEVALAMVETLAGGAPESTPIASDPTEPYQFAPRCTAPMCLSH
jgi:hypothetical protein